MSSADGGIVPPSRDIIESMLGSLDANEPMCGCWLLRDGAKRRHAVERDQHARDRRGVETRLGERDAADRGAALHGQQAGVARASAGRAQEREEHGVAIVGGREHVARAHDRERAVAT